jgi:hypothetical protein
LHLQKFGCTPKNEGKRVHVPPDEKTCGHAETGSRNLRGPKTLPESIFGPIRFLFADLVGFIHIEHICTFFSATIDGRNLVFGHKLHIGMPYCGKCFWTPQIPTSCFSMPTGFFIWGYMYPFTFILPIVRKIRYNKQHGARPCVEKMQLISFVPPNEELEIVPPKIWMYPQKSVRGPSR